jgi:hypothetical protein
LRRSKVKLSVFVLLHYFNLLSGEINHSVGGAGEGEGEHGADDDEADGVMHYGLVSVGAGFTQL